MPLQHEIGSLIAKITSMIDVFHVFVIILLKVVRVKRHKYRQYMETRLKNAGYEATGGLVHNKHALHQNVFFKLIGKPLRADLKFKCKEKLHPDLSCIERWTRYNRNG